MPLLGTFGSNSIRGVKQRQNTAGSSMSVIVATSTITQDVPAGTWNYFIMGGGGSGGGTHTGAGGAGFIETGTFTHSGGNIIFTVGQGGPSDGIAGNGSVGNNGGTTSIQYSSSTVSISGGQARSVNQPGGDGSSGGGGAGNSGFGGSGGSGGSSGNSGAQYGGGSGQGTSFFSARTSLLQNGLRLEYPTALVTPGAGGAAGNQSHAAGGGAGGIIIQNVDGVSSPNAQNGASSNSGRGGQGFGAGGGSGGYDGNYYAAGSGASGIAVIWL